MYRLVSRYSSVRRQLQLLFKLLGGALGLALGLLRRPLGSAFPLVRLALGLALQLLGLSGGVAVRDLVDAVLGHVPCGG